MSTTEVENITSQVENMDIQEKTPIDPETTIFIGNVAHECTEDDLKKIFQGEFGDVEVDMPKKENREGHIPASKHAFVIFPQKIDFVAIKEKYDLTSINDREIHIKRAKTPSTLRALAERRYGGRGNFRGRQVGSRGNFRGSRGGFRGGRGGFRGGFQSSQRREKVPLDQMEKSKDTIYVNNVPFDSTKEQLAEFFGVSVESVVLPMRRLRNFRTGRSFPSDRHNRGIAFITFEEFTGDIVAKAEELNGKKLGERALVVDVAAVKPEHEEAEESEDETHAE
ncbi:hypothetical protein KAFR_0I01530 [Kazachstania africana CBS 2517]|uniref:RRM domain-containing protein n=1 Tax=Kazachstania africana (strain ATCC 22294 / BCRC 22015 / CBS 2517 / CECT 1963 / NBRC 1671 / NRRL Y-8276) TaxID=1071382 RepID=H2AZY4_KAZAF|nr:hypothetical protein KAFR_0I01530 [Kazachstania africana CBS 2517]CCF59934.1 hypothetical protein KAFR_0I01530 [Kazachstania africana CBS 2517]